jgi:hypothetical protein
LAHCFIDACKDVPAYVALDVVAVQAVDFFAQLANHPTFMQVALGVYASFQITLCGAMCTLIHTLTCYINFVVYSPVFA